MIKERHPTIEWISFKQNNIILVVDSYVFKRVKPYKNLGYWYPTLQEEQFSFTLIEDRCKNADTNLFILFNNHNLLSVLNYTPCRKGLIISCFVLLFKKEMQQVY
ncbi:hypothetical protein MXB_3892 [Myxobolus squamalis]|nr:hypothetical protein MXB_3892 [Myxobolus squamalis]